jgi:hypothetical protein
VKGILGNVRNKTTEEAQKERKYASAKKAVTAVIRS